MNTQFKGIWPVVPTPFLNDGSVDYEGMLSSFRFYN